MDRLQGGMGGSEDAMGGPSPDYQPQIIGGMNAGSMGPKNWREYKVEQALKKLFDMDPNSLYVGADEESMVIGGMNKGSMGPKNWRKYQAKQLLDKLMNMNMGDDPEDVAIPY